MLIIVNSRLDLKYSFYIYIKEIHMYFCDDLYGNIDTIYMIIQYYVCNCLCAFSFREKYEENKSNDARYCVTLVTEMPRTLWKR